MDNQTIFQFFHWYYPSEGNLWDHAKEQAAYLASLGVTQVWLPPAYKSAGGKDEPGYAVYDLYDLGEFDQKGSVRTKWGTKDEYIQCINTFHDHGIKVIADIVLNHRIGGDEREKIWVQEVDSNDRTKLTGEPFEMEASTKFLFSGRAGKYSEYIWDQHSFTGLCENKKIALIKNEYENGRWEHMQERERGNFDYLMGNDVQFRNQHVREEIKNWGAWYTAETGIDGYRLDGLKHIPPDFYPEWLDHLRDYFKKDFLCIGEFWQNSAPELTEYIHSAGERVQLFDTPLHFSFQKAAVYGESYPLNTVLERSLTQLLPSYSITFVDNHDTQPLQSLQSPVEQWFTPHAYALILLREQATPCVFYPAVYGASYDDKGQHVELPVVPCIEIMMKVRKYLAYGRQTDHFDHASTVGWTREGAGEREHSGCAVVLSNGHDGYKRMSMGEQNKGRSMIDCCRNRADKIMLNEYGEADFPVNGGMVSVWIFEEAKLP